MASCIRIKENFMRSIAVWIPKTGSIRYYVTFPNPGNILRPGQFGKVRFVADMKKGAMVIPQEAVNELQGSYQVAVVGRRQ